MSPPSMTQSPLSSDWITQFSDPYAVLGIAVTADTTRVQKRYHRATLSLHPDTHLQSDEVTKQFAELLLTRVINPAYSKIKQEKGRSENLALLRLRARQLTLQGPFVPQTDRAKALLEHPASGVDVFYEQAVSELAKSQFEVLSKSQFETVTKQLGELNLAYLHLKLGELPPREQRTGLIPAVEATPIIKTPHTSPEGVTRESYDKRHFRRAREYMRNGNWGEAIKELQDAIRINPHMSEYHSHLGACYFYQEKATLAKVYIRQSLKLNPDDSLAKRFAAKVGLEIPATAPATNTASTPNQSPVGKRVVAKKKGTVAKDSRANRGIFGFFHWLGNLFRSLFGKKRSNDKPGKRPS